MGAFEGYSTHIVLSFRAAKLSRCGPGKVLLESNRVCLVPASRSRAARVAASCLRGGCRRELGDARRYRPEHAARDRPIAVPRAVSGTGIPRLRRAVAALARARDGLSARRRTAVD